MADLMAAQIDLLITAAPTAVAQIKGGRARALAITGAQRLPVLPDVPTFKDVGLPGYQVVNWFGLAAPKGTPNDVITKLHGAVQKSMADPALRDALAQQGAVPGGQSPAEFSAFLKRETQLWANVARQANVKPE